MLRASWYVPLSISKLNVYADDIQFTAFICVLFILPTARPVNSQNMNYAIVAIGGLLVIVFASWAFWGRTAFTGPVKTLAVEGLVEEKIDQKLD